MKEKKTRLTVDLTPEMSKGLDSLTKSISSNSKGDTVRTAPRIVEYLCNKQRDGHDVLLRKNGESEVLVLWF